MKEWRQEIPLAALGFFALVAQTLLFRDFLTSLDGNEIAVGTFFGSWLIWVGIGAVAGKLVALRFPSGVSRFLFLPLLYIPACLGQHLLIGNARAILGVQSFFLVPLPSLVAFTALANGPTSLLTGFLFSLACTWVKKTFSLPVARVYILETFGGFAGGLFVTGLLSIHLPEEKIFLVATLLLVLALLVSSLPKKLHVLWWAAIATSLAACVFAANLAGTLAAKHTARKNWARLLPADTYKGSFSTPQSRYLHGERDGDFIVMTEGGVIETLPEEEHASELAAIAIAENPRATNVLIIGSNGLAIANRLQILPQIGKIIWLHPDPEFPAKMLAVLPQHIAGVVGSIEAPQEEIRSFLEKTDQRFDLVLINLPEATTLVLNRYYSQAFYSLIGGVLKEDGVCGVRISGGANYLGGERVLTGASTLTTLSSVFPHIALKPGEESFLFAAADDVLSQSATELTRRFLTIAGSAQLYPPEGILSAFPQDRIAFQKGRYREALEKYGELLLINTDDHPKALLFDLLVTLRRAGFSSILNTATFLVAHGTFICLAGILLYGLLRVVYRWKTPSSPADTQTKHLTGTFDIQVMLFLAGLVGMSATIALIFCYQVRYGALFLHIGLISSLFMLGSALGGLVCEQVISRDGVVPSRLIPALTLFESLFFVVLMYLLPLDASRTTLALCFFLIGAFSGFSFPLAAAWLQQAKYRVEAAAGRLELIDHLGGGMGAFLAGLLLLPFFGVRAALAILLLAILVVNLLAQWSRGGSKVLLSNDRFDRLRRPLGYLLFGFGTFAVFISQSFHYAENDQGAALFQRAAAEMAGTLEAQERQTNLRDGRILKYYRIPGGYIFPSASLTKGIRGYGGEIPLAVRLDEQGVLHDFHLLRSNETPVYLAFLRRWLENLKGREMYGADPFQDIGAVSGATMSSVAIMRTLQHSADAFGETILERPPRSNSTSSLPVESPWQFTALLLWTMVALVARYKPNRRVRRAILAGSLFLFAILFNLQYASQHVMSLLSGNFSLEMAASSGFFLMVVFPVAVIFFGNFYCGYLCPFGALQELIGDLRPGRIQSDPRKRFWRYGRFAKYLVLFFFLLLFVMTDDFSVLSADPLITVFSHARDRMTTLLALCLLSLAFFFRRFWCRNLCPAGAFLALLGGIRLCHRFLPKTRPERCDLGVMHSSDLDCLQCDRCRHENS